VNLEPVNVDPVSVAVAFAVALALFLLFFLGVTTFNLVVALRQRADKAWANIEVVLQQRHDQLPGLVNAVKGLMGFEQAVLEEVTRQRARWSPDDPPPAQAAASDGTSAAVRTLFATVEAYPDISSQENVLELQGQIARIEEMIADRRELYNDSVYRYNTTIRQVPGVLLAPVLRWRQREFFEARPEDRERPDVSLLDT
jgi:LemA protein